MKHSINEFDIFYLSYDEPQKEEFWAKLLDIFPWAKRIDGVKGFDAAHKACANASTTDRFITVDGDNLVDPSFLELEIDIPDKLSDVSLSWACRNEVNGLCYGNGGLKLWTKEFVLNMRTHEAATKDEEKVDFCWDDKYVQLNNTYSTTYTNGSPFQAFRAGFREGVKMTLDRGVKAGEGSIAKHMHAKNYNRLLIWASIGEDVENGIWSIYGTRLGIYQANINKDFDIAQISDYDWFKKYFNEEVATKFAKDGEKKCWRTGLVWNEHTLRAESTKLLEPLKKQLDMNIADMGKTQSLFFKSVYEAPKRNSNPIITETDADKL
jgi:hypothetical protein